MRATYEQYTATVKSHASANQAYPDLWWDLDFLLRTTYPGIQVRICDRAEHAKEDATIGPDPSIVSEIDETLAGWIENLNNNPR